MHIVRDSYVLADYQLVVAVAKRKQFNKHGFPSTNDVANISLLSIMNTSA